MVDDVSLIWLGLRARRFSLREGNSKLESSSARRKTLSAAMEQFEEQMTAAKAVTAATRPINLYYGLAQAGMAIAAVHATQQWSWIRHWLKIVDAAPGLPEICIQPSGDGGFQRVSDAMDSPQISGPVSIDALWSSLPDLGGQLRFRGSRAALPLLVSPDSSSRSTTVIIRNPQGPTTRIERPSRTFAATVYIPKPIPDVALQKEWLEEFLGTYPSLTGWMLSEDEDSPLNSIDDRQCKVKLKWRNFKPDETLSWEEFNDTFDCIVPRYRYRGDRYALPAVEPNGAAPPSPLMTWWLLLYAFSILARYQPRKWVDLLDLDHSEYAAYLQFALDEAMTAIPHLVLEALDGESFLTGNP
jgi:hypothetical protein